MNHLLSTALLFALMLTACSVKGQYHIQVEPNPDHNGEINPRWTNNYVVAFTMDDWKTKSLISSQQTYQGYDDNGVTYYVSYYKTETFQLKEDAIRFAKQFASINKVGKYLKDQLMTHKRMHIHYEGIKSRLCFGCHPAKNKKESPIAIY